MSHIEHISTSLVSGNPAAYSQATVVGQQVFCSGCIGIDSDRKFTSTTIEGQTLQTIANLTQVLKAAQCELKDVAKVLILLTNMEHYQTVNKIYAEAFPQPLPARSCVAVAGLPLGALIEIECIAFRPS